MASVCKTHFQLSLDTCDVVRELSQLFIITSTMRHQKAFHTHPYLVDVYNVWGWWWLPVRYG